MTEVRPFFEKNVDLTKLRGLCFAGTNIVGYADNQPAFWSGLPSGRLSSLLRGRGGGENCDVDLLAISISPDDDNMIY
jgi:hypothetical protein